MNYAVTVTIIMVVQSIVIFFILFGRSKVKSEKEIKSEIAIKGLLDRFNDNDKTIKNIDKAREELKNAKIDNINDFDKLMSEW